MKKQFFVAAMALVLGAGFTACSSDDLNAKPGTEVNQKATTYMSVSFVLPTANSTRAAADGQDKTTGPDFKYVGKWNGQDKIESVAVYVFKAAGATIAGTDVLESTQNFSAADLAFNQNTGGKTFVNAQKAFKVLPGLKKVYVVVNPTAAANSLLAGKTTVADFEAAYKSADLGLTNPTVLTADMPGDATRADEVSPVENKGAATAKDKIIMTGAGVEITLADNISAAQAISGVQNRAELSVQRASARVLVTTATGKESFEIKGIDPENPATKDAVIATVSKLSYVVAQGEAKLYFLQQENANVATNGAAFTTPAFDQVNADGDFWDKDQMRDYAAIGKHYDYSGLWKNPDGFAYKGLKVPSRVAFDKASAASELGNVTTDLAKDLKSEFVLPTLHKYNTDRKQSGYRKGNTAYILVRGLLTPKKYIDENGAVKTDNALEGKDFYVGANGFIYKDKACVQDPTKKGIAGQTAQLYKGGKVLYFVWINPDAIDSKAVNSPVIRNNVYHVQISGVAKIGSNWNPLVPYPDGKIPGGSGKINPNDPSAPDNPNNPDPRPKNDLEPKDPPVDPKDPITSKETWMSVSVTILPWAVHSYEVELSI